MPPTPSSTVLPHAPAAPLESNSDELRFDFNGLVSPPYTLHRYLFDFYQGDALLVAGHSPVSTYLSVPPNVAAVILLANGDHVALNSGRHLLRAWLKYPPIGVQFVNLQRQPFTYTVKIRSWGELELVVGLRVILDVVDAKQVTHWREPLADVESLVKQALMTVAANNSYDDCVRTMPTLLNGPVKAQVDAACRARGLAVSELMMTSLEADKQFSEMERDNLLAIKQMLVDMKKFEQQRAVTEQEANLKEEQSQREHQQKMHDFEREEEAQKRRREVELFKAQVEEDINAMLQPGRKRMAVTEVNKIMGQRSFEIRLKAIDALQEIVKTILEDRARHPGQFASTDDTQVLNDALTMLKEWSAPAAAIPSPPIRSHLAMDKYPEPPPVAEPLKPDGQTS